MFDKVEVNGPKAHPLVPVPQERAEGPRRDAADQVEFHQVPRRSRGTCDRTFRADDQAFRRSIRRSCACFKAVRGKSLRARCLCAPAWLRRRSLAIRKRSCRSRLDRRAKVSPRHSKLSLRQNARWPKTSIRRCRRSSPTWSCAAMRRLSIIRANSIASILSLWVCPFRQRTLLLPRRPWRPRRLRR